ncbi:MAG: hypothetical protein K2Q01_08280, partial [Rickettsiales bacterium]|nr:hypothetical protein [Rickettsiales bacterium]
PMLWNENQLAYHSWMLEPLGKGHIPAREWREKMGEGGFRTMLLAAWALSRGASAQDKFLPLW